MKQRTFSTLIFILAVIFVVTALAAFVTKLVPKNESAGNPPEIIKPTPTAPVRKPVEDVKLSQKNYTFVGIG